jgi:hypothetical protein
VISRKSLDKPRARTRQRAAVTIDAAADEPTEPTADELRLDLYSWIISALDIAEALSKQEPSRELSIVKTKLEEAEMWLLKLEREEGQ